MKIDKPLTTQIIELRSLWKDAFGDTDAFLDIFFKTAFCQNRCRCVTLDGKVVAALYWFDCSYGQEKIAYIYAVGTLKTYRNRGLSHKLMSDTHAHLQYQGYAGALLVPGSQSLFDFYKGIGYQICTSVREFHYDATAEKDSKTLRASSLVKEDFDTFEEFNNVGFLTEIEKNEYALLREEYLPAGAVIQKNENLDFLAATARFYKGQNCLLAATQYDNKLFVTEFLGDESNAPFIIQALACKEGTFRTPGNEKAFSMYYPLTKETTPPKYFGWAFD